MAMSFVLIQYVEYRELTFTISDGVYSSLFFLLTGFHGMHVIVGTIFILYTLKALNNLEITTSRNIRVGLALIY
jgi:cytochrome c oxidase subunit 3